MLTPSSQQLSELDNNDKKISKNTEDLNNTILYLDLLDISKTPYNQQLQNSCTFQEQCGILTKNDHTLGHKIKMKTKIKTTTNCYTSLPLLKKQKPFWKVKAIPFFPEQVTIDAHFDYRCSTNAQTLLNK